MTYHFGLIPIPAAHMRATLASKVAVGFRGTSMRRLIKQQNQKIKRISIYFRIRFGIFSSWSCSKIQKLLAVRTKKSDLGIPRRGWARLGDGQPLTHVTRSPDNHDYLRQRYYITRRCRAAVGVRAPLAPALAVRWLSMHPCETRAKPPTSR